MHSSELLFFSALAFGWLMRTGLYPPELKSTNLDFDWTYRRLFPRIINEAINIITALDKMVRSIFLNRIERLIAGVFRYHGPDGLFARTNTIGTSVSVIVALLAIFVILFFLEF